MLSLILGLAALAGGTLSAVTGMAGGILLLAVMLAAGMPIAVAIPIHALVQLVSNGTRILTLLRHVRWRPALTLIVFAAPGPLLGFWIAARVDVGWIQLALGLLILYTLLAPKLSPARLPVGPSFAIAGAIGGVFGVVIGAIGPLVGPFVKRDEWPKETIIGTQAACQTSLHLVKLVAFGVAGFAVEAHVQETVAMIVGVVAGTLIGRQLLDRISPRAFRAAFTAVLAALAVRLILAPWVAL